MRNRGRVPLCSMSAVDACGILSHYSELLGRHTSISDSREMRGGRDGVTAQAMAKCARCGLRAKGIDCANISVLSRAPVALGV